MPGLVPGIFIFCGRSQERFKISKIEIRQKTGTIPAYRKHTRRTRIWHV